MREPDPADARGTTRLAAQRHGRNPEVHTAERVLRSGDPVLVQGIHEGLNRGQEAPLPVPVAVVVLSLFFPF